MVEYNPKLKSLYKRDDNFKFTDKLTDERFRQIKYWTVTEKMDGQSVILSIFPGDTAFYGRSSKTNFSVEQRDFMSDMLDKADRSLIKNPRLYDKTVNIYAELVGPGINGNKHNFSEYRLYPFDVKVDGYWLDYNNMRDVLDDVPDHHLPEHYHWVSLEDVVSWARDYEGSKYLEGYVARTDPYLYDNKGNRVAFKVKVSDFNGTK